ncbi:hypothetical protein CapIbe_013651 [Capra ibex]
MTCERSNIALEAPPTYGPAPTAPPFSPALCGSVLRSSTRSAQGHTGKFPRLKATPGLNLSIQLLYNPDENLAVEHHGQFQPGDIWQCLETGQERELKTG